MSSANIQLPMVSTWDSKPSGLRKSSPSSTRSASTRSKASSSHRVTKRTSPHVESTMSYNDHLVHAHGGAGRRGKRVWKACERCRMKKTKCDGEFPCQRCNDDGLICTASVRKRPGYKQLPSGYAEVLENTQLVLVATIRKLYEMVRNHDEWRLGEPRCNDRGQAIIHNIAQKLACIRSNGDIDLPVQSVFPEDMEGMEHLASILRKQQATLEAEDGSNKSSDGFSGYSTEANSPEYHSDLDHELCVPGPEGQDSSLQRSYTPENIGTASKQLALAEGSELGNYQIYPSSQLDDFSYAWETSTFQPCYDDESSRSPPQAQFNKTDVCTEPFGPSGEFEPTTSQTTSEQDSQVLFMPCNAPLLWQYSKPRAIDDSMLQQLLRLSDIKGLGIDSDMLNRLINQETLSAHFEATSRLEEPMEYSAYGGF
ncbi:unnamed protein product [Clonostachys rhizophaga]|uniref:Zn(2)-C6 fungal-type domain-containing protein n=1 Tax=Clonostachys rhizophaga TaxID=160324 RepID=A0A9N9VFU9_9HYPO|nr:unnamed protein product [Clonostachys rhizophaga]